MYIHDSNESLTSQREVDLPIGLNQRLHCHDINTRAGFMLSKRANQINSITISETIVQRDV